MEENADDKAHQSGFDMGISSTQMSN